MTTLVTADPHKSANPRDAYRWLFLEETLPRLITEHDVDRVLILGDLTEIKDGHPAELVNRLVDGIVRIARLLLQGAERRSGVFILKGNHDYLAEDCPFFRFLQHVPGVRWINQPTVLSLRGLGRCWFLPHSARWADEWGDLAAAGHGGARDFRGTDWFFCHQTFGGAALGGRHKAQGSAPPFTRKAGDRVISGDVHAPQQLGAITYVGSPYRIDFGDDFEPRVLLLDGHKMRSIPVPGPQKRLVTISGRDPLAALGMKHPLGAIAPLSTGDVVKVRVELPPKFGLSRSEVRARVRAWADAAGVLLHATEVLAPAAEPAAARSASRSRVPDADLVRAYARKMRKGKATVAAGLKLAEEVA